MISISHQKATQLVLPLRTFSLSFSLSLFSKHLILGQQVLNYT